MNTRRISESQAARHLGDTVTATDPFPAVSTVPGRRLHILYADDVRELREIARISFGRAGHHIDCVADGDEALAHLLASPDCDVLITDHCMPTMVGTELVARLRARQFQGKIIVFCSELSAPVAADYRALHVDRILYKPVFPSALRQVLADLFPDSAPCS